MLKTFVLLATIWNPTIGVNDVYVIDHDMSGGDCIAVLLDVAASAGFEIEPGNVVSPAGIILSCELE